MINRFKSGCQPVHFEIGINDSNRINLILQKVETSPSFDNEVMISPGEETAIISVAVDPSLETETEALHQRMVEVRAFQEVECPVDLTGVQ